MNQVKPNLFIIGASKCGTTSLYNILKRQKDICMSSIKEPHYFAGKNSKKSLEWYLSLFRHCDENKKIIGEASPIYSETTYFPDVAASFLKI